MFASVWWNVQQSPGGRVGCRLARKLSPEDGVGCKLARKPVSPDSRAHMDSGGDCKVLLHNYYYKLSSVCNQF